MASAGHVRFRKGAWRIAVYKGRNPRTGRHDYLYGTHRGPNNREGKKSAQLEAARLLIQAQQQRARDVDAMDRSERKMKDILSSYLTWGTGDRADGQRGKRQPWSASTLNVVASLIEGRINTYSANKRAQPFAEIVGVDLTADYLQTMYDRWMDPDDEWEGLSESYVAKLHGIIHAALQRAVKKGWLDVNVASLVEDKPSQEGRKIVLPTETEMSSLFAACEGDIAAIAWLLLAMSFGARRGAMCALRWRHLDLDDGYVTWERAISDGGKRYGAQEKGLKADNPFTATLNSLEIKTLKELRVKQRLAAGPGWNEEYFVFGSKHGAVFVHPGTATHRFVELRDKAGLKITLHQLKHYGVTNLLKAKVPLFEVAARVGTNQRTLERRYVQWMRGLDERSSDAMTELQSRLLGAKAPTPVTPIDAKRRKVAS